MLTAMDLSRDYIRLLKGFLVKNNCKGSKQRSYTRWLYKRIYKTEMKFWAVLGSRGCREKKLPTAISKELFQVVFSTFCGQKKFLKNF
jgi:hypothetical protein